MNKTHELSPGDIVNGEELKGGVIYLKVYGSTYSNAFDHEFGTYDDESFEFDAESVEGDYDPDFNDVVSKIILFFKIGFNRYYVKPTERTGLKLAKFNVAITYNKAILFFFLKYISLRAKLFPKFVVRIKERNTKKLESFFNRNYDEILEVADEKGSFDL